MESFIYQECNFKINTKLDRQPVKVHQDRGNMSTSWYKTRHSSSGIENSLKTLKLVLGNAEQERIAVVQAGPFLRIFPWGGIF